MSCARCAHAEALARSANRPRKPALLARDAGDKFRTENMPNPLSLLDSCHNEHCVCWPLGARLWRSKTSLTHPERSVDSLSSRLRSSRDPAALIQRTHAILSPTTSTTLPTTP